MSSMATSASGESQRRQSSRLRRRAPASLQIGPAPSWNVAIPLLSPLASSPGRSDWNMEESRQREEQNTARAEPEKSQAVMFKKWQHPAAPFCCEPGPFVPPFVPV